MKEISQPLHFRYVHGGRVFPDEFGIILQYCTASGIRTRNVAVETAEDEKAITFLSSVFGDFLSNFKYMGPLTAAEIASGGGISFSEQPFKSAINETEIGEKENL
jgi:hypothetical protein